MKMIIKNEKTIAILLAIYNGEKYLSEQIDSVIAQTDNNWTLYIRDDSSTDSTQSVIDDYCSRFNNIIQIKDSKGNLGCRGNFFELLQKVESKYYMFCDGDDVWNEDKVEISLRAMHMIEDRCGLIPLLVHTDYMICDNKLNVIVSSYWKTIKLDPDKFMTYNQLGVSPMVGGSLMLFNEMAKQVSLLDSDNLLMYDASIALSVLKSRGYIYALHVPTKKYRQHENNFYGVSMTKRKLSFYQKIRNTISLNKRQIELLKSANWGGGFKYVYFKFFVKLKLSFLKLI